MTSDLRRSFKQKAKEAFGLPFRFRMGLEKLDSEASGGGVRDGSSAEEFAPRSTSFDIGYFTTVNRDLETENKITAELQQVTVNEDFVLICDQDKDTKKKSQNTAQPKGLIPYTVSVTDTLPRVAAQFKTTTSELKKLNRLMSDMVCPGKIIYVPDKDYVPDESRSESSTPPEASPRADEKQEAESDTLDVANKPSTGAMKMPNPDLLLMGMKPILSVARQAGSPGPANTSDGTRLTDDSYHEQFLKLNVNHILDAKKEEMVGGVLLITPKAVMFESNPGDDLVLKNGRDLYDVFVPMSAIVGVMICHDLIPAKPSLREASSFEDDIFLSNIETGTVGLVNQIALAAESCNQKPISKQEAEKDEKTLSMELVCDSKSYGEIGDGFGGDEKCKLTEFGDKGTTTKASYEVKYPFSLSNVSGGKGESMFESLKRDTDPTCQKEESSMTVEHISSDVDTTAELQHVGLVSEIKRPNEKEMQSDPSSSFDSPRKRCSTLVGNIFRFPYGGSSYEHVCQPLEKETEKDGDVEPAKEPDSECSTPTHRLMTRTLVSLTSYSRPLVDLSSSLFSRSGSDSKSPKKEDESSSPKFDSAREKENRQEPVQSQRIFFLRPLDLLIKKNRGSTEEIEIPELEQTSAAAPDEPSTLYMCLKIEQFIDWSTLKDCPVAISNLSSRLKPEYWFTIPSDRVDHLYAFFLQWSPNVTGTVDEISLAERGFVVIGSTDGSTSGGLDDELKKLNFAGTSCQASKEWEIINAKEVRRMINIAEIESLPLPELSDISKIMDTTHVQELCFHLPPRAEGCPWNLVYSSDKHGFSLKTLYRRMARVDSPILLVIKDVSNQVFGAMLPCALKMSDSFYGSGESYLFSFYQTFKKYSWTGHNNYFIKGNAASLAIGSGEGVYGLWLDGDLYHGRTQSCLTYCNDLLTVSEDFTIQCLEAWRFV